MTPIRKPIFIAGAGRSGTTLLRSLLSAHPHISVTPETHYMKRAEKWGLLERDGPADFEAFWKRYTTSVRFRDLDVDPARCREYIDQGGQPTFRSIFAAVLAAYGDRVGKPRIGEKTPGHVHFIQHLLAWFPDSKILILRRDPRAVVASQMRSPWVQDRLTPLSLTQGVVTGSYAHQLAFYADDWATMYDDIVPEAQGDERVLIVPYESLVTDAERELRRICGFLEEPFEPAMLSGRSDDTVPIPASTADLSDKEWQAWRKEHHAKTLQPVSTASLTKWKQQLSTVEVAMIEGRCGQGMQRAGYVPGQSSSRRLGGGLAVRSLLSLERTESGLRESTTSLLRRWRRRTSRLVHAAGLRARS